MTENKKLIGVVFSAVFFLILGSLSFISLVIPIISGLPGTADGAERLTAMLWLLAIGICFMSCGVGLMLHKNWSRFLATGLSILSLFKLFPLVIEYVTSGESVDLPPNIPFFYKYLIIIVSKTVVFLPIAFIVIFILIVFYINRPIVRNQFKRDKA